MFINVLSAKWVVRITPNPPRLRDLLRRSVREILGARHSEDTVIV